MDWHSIKKGTDGKWYCVKMILLKITIMKELAMYNTMDGQCIWFGKQ